MLKSKLKFALLASVLTSQLPLPGLAYVVPPGSPGFYHGNSTAAVTFDEHSLFLGDKRLFVFSGEVHPWRLPTGKAGWRDVFQKMKAAGFNTASVYHHWGISEGKQGELDFNYYRSQTDVYDVAKEVGLLVITRAGPYVNAETIGGGFPGWLTNNPATARTNDTGYTDAWTPYITAVAKFLAPYQYPDGPIIAVQSENEFFQSTAANPGRSEYMQLIENTYRNNGVTKVPLTHNEAGRTKGVYAPGVGLGQVDLYTWDNYPNGFDCSNPGKWNEVDPQLDTDHKNIDPDLVWASAEFGGGAFDPWGGFGYNSCYLLTNEQYTNVFYKNNYAAETHYQSIYMTYGGTNWGNLAEPTVYTSYDYGAPIHEDRTLSPKYYEIKLQTGFLHASPDFLVATRFGNGTVGSGTAFSDNARVYTTGLSSPNGTSFYVVRQTSNSYLDPVQFQLQINTTEGTITVPQYGGNITLDGRESQILVSEYPFGSHVLKYSTAEIFTWTTIDDIDYLVLYAQAGHSIEVVVPTYSYSNPQVLGSNTIQAKSLNGSTVITGTTSGLSGVVLDGAVVIIADKQTALSFWNAHLSSSSGPVYDISPDVPSVLLYSPYLVRNASISGSTLELYGDINATTTLGVIAPSSVKSVTWNGQQISAQSPVSGVFEATLPFNVQVELPSLRSAEWYCADSLPEIQPDFDDGGWVTANKTNTSRPLQPLAGKYVLYADEYGFHQGNLITRGHFTGNNATGVKLSVQGGYNFGYSAWLNSKFLGSSQGTNQYSSDGGIDLTNDTWAFDAGDLNEGDNVLTVVVDQTGLEEDPGGSDKFKTPRGVRGYTLLGGGDFDYWKVQGNLGGEDFVDKVRGPLNEGGLFVERQGAHLPEFPLTTTGWNKSTSTSSCTPYDGISSADIRAYRTTFDLDLPSGSDIPIALQFERTPSSSYRSVIYINGWQFGRFNSRDGPQTLYSLPEGILNPRGSNELLITLWSLDAAGAKIADVELAQTSVLSSSKEPTAGKVTSPGYDELRK